MMKTLLTGLTVGLALATAPARAADVVRYRGTIESTLLDGLPPEPAAAASDSIDGALAAAFELVADRVTFLAAIPVKVVISRRVDDRDARQALRQPVQGAGQGHVDVAGHPGPVVTLYELEPSPGTKSSRVIGLADDIARSMSARACRV